MDFPDAEKRSCVQFTAHMININAGHSSGIMSKCPRLYEYALLIEEIRQNQKKGLSFEEAAVKAVDTCIEKGILKDILIGNKAEVTKMILEEYNESKHIANEKELSFQEGVRQERANTLKEKERADEAAKRADEAARREEHALQQSKILMMLLQKKSEEEIADKLGLPLEEIRKIVLEIYEDM